MRDYERLREQDRRDVDRMARFLSSPLHYTTNTQKCVDPTRCRMCSNAARLAVQHYRPVIEKRVVNSLMALYDISCTMHHPSSDD